MTTHRSLESVVIKTSLWNRVNEPRQHIQYVDVSAVSSSRLEIVIPASIDGKKAPSRAQKIIQTGDVLFATIRPSLKRIAKVPQKLDGEVASTAFCVLRPNPKIINSNFLFFSVCNDSFVSSVAEHEAGASYPAVRDKDIFERTIWVPDLQIQSKIARCVDVLHRATLRQLDLIEQAETLKHAAMSQLFTCGLRGEAQKESEIGLIPDSWKIKRLDKVAKVISTRMSYSELESMEDSISQDTQVLGVKVSDMNRFENQLEILSAATSKAMSLETTSKKCAPPNTIVFPKRGAAIATNKKRLTTTWTVFDPNVIGVSALNVADTRYLFHWFQKFDLKTITEPGPTPQLNKKHLDPLQLPITSDPNERDQIVEILDSIDKKIALHQQKKLVLDELFRSLLNKLMTGEISVHDLDLSALSDKEPQPQTEAEVQS